MELPNIQAAIDSETVRRFEGRKRKKKQLDRTPRSQIRSAIRQLWLRSVERRSALKRDRYTCVDCGIKQSKAKGREVKVQVDHLDGIDWEKVIEYIQRHVLVSHDRLETVCVPDHGKRTELRKLEG